MGKRIVIALGGNALGKNLPEQMLAVKETSKAIADLVEAGHTVVVAHGNGPQVGMIQNAFAAYCRQEPSADVMPLSMCVAMSQGYIGYDLQNALREELLDRGLQQGVATVLTQVVVDGNDPAFQHPTKPIGAFMSQEEAEKMAREKGWHIAEDAGRGWRQVVASPKPLAVVELTTIRALAEADNVVIACGGGGIPVIATDVGGTHEIVSDGVNGFLLPSDCGPEDVAAAIKRFVFLGKAEGSSMRRAARAVWERDFRLEANVEGLVRSLGVDYRNEGE